MLHNKLNNYIGLLFVLLFFVSCTPNNQTEEGKSAIIRLLVNSSNSNVKTRSGELTTAEEDVINDIHILVYNSQGELIGHKYTSYNPSNPSITVETRSSNSNCTIYAIANTGSSTYFNGKAYSEDNLKTLVTEDLLSVDGIKKGTSGSQYFLMSGRLLVSKIDPGTSTVSTPLSLSRLAAKIKFNITASNGITITDYCIKNVPKNSYLIDHTSADAATNYLSTGLTTLSAGTTSVSDQYFYMYENRKGGRTGTGAPTDQTGKALYAPVNSTYMEIHAKSSTFNGLFKIYLGADNISDYNIKRNNSYTYDIQLLGPGYADTRVTHYGFTLSANNSISTNTAFAPGSANCYIVAPSASLLIPVQRANESDLGPQISDVTSTTEWTASLLWQTTPGLVTVSNPTDARAFGCFKVTSSSSSGNAVVAIKNTSGKILWSWHIWITNYNPDTSPIQNGAIYSYNNGIKTTVFMDRNLGATNATVGDIGSAGLMYQWGRKDPFTGPASLSSAQASDGLPIYDSAGNKLIEGSASGMKYVFSPATNCIASSIQNPLLFYYGVTENNYNWFTNTAGVTNNYLWRDDYKTIYDPCPAGWRITSSGDGTSSPWYGLTISNGTYTPNSGWNWISFGAGYYPASGLRHYGDAKCYNVGVYCYSWSTTANSNGINIWYFDCNNARVSPSYCIEGYSRAYGMPVRCVKER